MEIHLQKNFTAATHDYNDSDPENFELTDTIGAKKVINAPLCVNRIRKNPLTKKIVKDKRVYCLFCEKLETNFPRHLERRHALEPEVKQLILLPKHSKDRLKHLELIKNKGNFQYNRNILEKKQGSLIVGRRPTDSDKIDVADYVPCNYCFKFFKKKKLYRHTKKCQFNDQPSEKDAPKKRNMLVKSALLLQNTNDFKQLTKEVFSSMRCDDITLTAKNDETICAFGTRLLLNHRDLHLKSYISQRMRQLSKLLLHLRKLVPELSNLKDFLIPKYFRTVVNATLSLSGYNDTNNTYKCPSVALKLGHSILQ